MHWSTIAIPVVVALAGIWLLRKLINIGLMLVIGAILVLGWWFFFVD